MTAIYQCDLCDDKYLAGNDFTLPAHIIAIRDRHVCSPCIKLIAKEAGLIRAFTPDDDAPIELD